MPGALGAKPTLWPFQRCFHPLRNNRGTGKSIRDDKNVVFRSSKISKFTGHVGQSYPIVGENNSKNYEGFKTIFLQAAKEMQLAEHRLFLNNESKVQKQLQDEGMFC